jgi:DNA polymerase I-like protein with 3'-5' exonuclease and polymerase domains/uracil-DNA glycosylase
MPIQVRPSGPTDARVMIVGEAPGAEEERKGEPFVGASGHELTKMLHEAGIARSQCFITNVCRERPPGNDINTFIAQAKKEITPAHIQVHGKWVLPPLKHGYDLLLREIELVKPNLILAFGNTPLWALTGKWGITKWRGSMLHTADGTRIIPTYHPAAVLRQWEWRAVAVNDLRRAAKYVHAEFPKPKWKAIVRPSYQTVLGTLTALLERLAKEQVELSFDIETRAGHIACAGVSWQAGDHDEGICIPFMCAESKSGYWMPDEEAKIVYLLYLVLTHRNACVIGQNQLYDCQYTYRHWHFVPRVTQDTMISWHVAFAGLPKNLAFQASMLNEQYVYWKDDGKEWNAKAMGEESLWTYNIEDCVRTHECAKEENNIIKTFGLQEVDEFQQQMFWPVLQAMQRGVRIDAKRRNALALELMEEMTKREQWMLSVLGHPLNPRSPQQMQRLFYDDLQLPKIISRTTGNPTLDDDALTRLCSKEPLVRPLVKCISEYRSLGVFLSTFVNAPLDLDGRMRCSYNICGTETYRLASRENAFGSGTNLQNVPPGVAAKGPDELSLPNVRTLFIPDDGYVFFDMDLDRADLQVVVWEADDLQLKEYLRLGVDMHLVNAYTMFDKLPDVSLLIERHTKDAPCTCPGRCYWEFRLRRAVERQLMKSWVHGTNYGGQPRTMAVNCGLSVKDATNMQESWFRAHPGIPTWHKRTEVQLHSKRFVENKYGYRRYYFERLEGLLPEALAWQPQSTVAITINKIWHRIYTNLPDVQVLLQVHDSLAGQFPRGFATSRIINEASQVAIPYPEPLTIPVGLKTSPVSWGDCS